jgi:hypothetical protein
MDQEQISKIEGIIEDHLFREVNTPDYELKKMDVMIEYLIYQQLKELNNNLSLIDEALSIDELKK